MAPSLVFRHVHIQVCVYACVHIHVCVCVCVCNTHTHTHTHREVLANAPLEPNLAVNTGAARERVLEQRVREHLRMVCVCVCVCVCVQQRDAVATLGNDCVQCRVFGVLGWGFDYKCI